MNYCAYLLSKEAEMHMINISLYRARRMSPTLDYSYIIFAMDHRRKRLMEQKDGGVELISNQLKRAYQNQEECKRYIR